MTTFRARVQYNDFVGTSAADRADNGDLDDFLKSKGLANDGEFLIAATVYIGENRGPAFFPGITSIHAILFAGSNFDAVINDLTAREDPIPVREVDVEITFDEFVRLFKRFAVNLTKKGLHIEDREYEIVG